MMPMVELGLFVSSRTPASRCGMAAGRVTFLRIFCFPTERGHFWMSHFGHAARSGSAASPHTAHCDCATNTSSIKYCEKLC